MRDKICRRRSDGTWWEPSAPDDYTRGQAMADLLSGRTAFYFREVEWQPSPWWKFWTPGQWVRTGRTWEPESGEFDVLYTRDYSPPPEEPAP